MKRSHMILILLMISTPGLAQTTWFGGRYSNYATDVEIAGVTLDPGRESSLGLVLDLRQGRFVLRAQLDHDFEGGFSPLDFLPIDFAEYSRDRFEAVAGYAVAEAIDLEAGVRIDSFEIGGLNFFNNNLFGDFSFDHEAVAVGIHLHSPRAANVQWYLSGRGYLGTVESDDLGFRASTDSTGFRIEAGLPIRVGESRWVVTPGLEYERIETDDFDLEFETNRLFLNFTYRFGA